MCNLALGAAATTQEEQRSRQPNIPWRAIAGTRDKLIHDYYLVDETLVREMVEEHLSPLRSAVEEILTELGDYPQPTA